METIKLTEKNLLRYGNIVLTREWHSQNNSCITERYIIWEHGRTPQMYIHTMVNGEFISMRRV